MATHQETTKVTIKELTTILRAAAERRRTVLASGAPGVGKTDAVKQVAEQLEYDLIIEHPSVREPIDFVGLPANVDGRAEFLPYGTLRRIIEAEQPTILFLDDLGQAPPAVQAACMQLLLAREVCGRKISDQVVMFAATNRKEDRCGVTGLLEAVKSRFATIVEVIPDVDEWCEWALEREVSIDVVAFIRWKPDMLWTFEPTHAMVNQPSPRTVANAADVIGWGLPPNIEYKTLSGAVGEGWTADFISFRELKSELPRIDTIFANPKRAKLPKSQGAKYSITTSLAIKITADLFGAAVTYLKRLKEKEFLVLFTKDVYRRDASIFETDAAIELCADEEYGLLIGVLEDEEAV